MSNLLDKASIILTPTAYKNNEALCVKPSDGSGDFDFSRNSAATRVNAQGLVENVQILSSNLVQNGDFSEEGAEEITNGDFSSDTAWVKGTGWTISGGSLNASAATATAFQQNTGIVTNKTYKVTYTISNYVSGSVRIEIGSANVSVGLVRSADGTYTEYITALGDDEVYFDGISAFTGSIDNVSVREVGQNWNLGSGWSIGDDVAISDGSVSGFISTSTNLFENGKTYKVGMTVSDMTTGQVTYPYDGAGSTPISSNGDFSQIYTADDTNKCFIYANNGFDGSITNISVIEITDETNLPRINYEGFSYQDVLGSEEITNGDFATDSDWIKQSSWTISNGTANYDGISTGNYLRQSWSPLTIGKTYRMTFDISDGSAYLQIRSGTSLLFEGLNIALYGTGSHVIEAKAISNLDNLRIYAYTSGGGTSFSIDNVSVKEVTGQEVVPDSGCGSWLFEPQSTNLFLKSEPTSAEGLSIGVSYESFDWSIGFDNCVRYPNNSTLYLHYGGTCLASTSYTLSYYIKMDNGEQPIYGTDFSHRIGNVSGTSPILTNMGNGVYRVSETKISSTSNLTRSGVIKDTVNSAIGFRITALQLEQQSYATSYIPTSGSTVTRNQDVCTGWR